MSTFIFIFIAFVVGLLVGWIAFALIMSPKLKKIRSDWRVRLYDYMLSEHLVIFMEQDENAVYYRIVEDE